MEGEQKDSAVLVLKSDGGSMLRFSCVRCVLAAFVAASFCIGNPSYARQNCEPIWLPGSAMSGVSDWVYDLARMPNGDLLAGGKFQIAGGVRVNRIARFDGVRWHALGSGLNMEVYGVTVAPNGEVYVCGDFSMAGGVPAARVARWDGANWFALGSGIPGAIFYTSPTCIEALPTGEIVVGGGFSQAGGVPARRVAVWNGASWRALGNGIYGDGSSAFVNALCVLPDGSLLAGGSQHPYMSRWDGQQWTELGITFNRLGSVFDIERMSDGRVYVCSRGAGAGYVGPLSMWNGTQWSSVAPQVNIGSTGGMYAVKTLSDGSKIIGGVGMGLSNGGTSIWKSILKWDQGIVQVLEPDLEGPFLNRRVGPASSALVENSITELEFGPHGRLFAGGGYHNTASGPVFAMLNDRGWTRETEAPDKWVSKIVPLRYGGALMCGGFASIGGAPAHMVARFDGAQWQEFGTGLITAGENENQPGDCLDVIQLRDGSVIATGTFTLAGGIAANRIARWDGVRWSPMGAGLDHYGWALLELANGDVLVAGSFRMAGAVSTRGIAKWNGESWEAVGGGVSGVGVCLIHDSDGSVLLGGDFLTAGGVPARNIARWNGESWSPVGDGFNGQVNSLLKRSDGTLLAGGSFTQSGARTINRVAMFVGEQWTPMVDGLNAEVWSLAEDVNGDVLAGGRFDSTGNTPLGGIGLARWNGSTWVGVANGVGGVSQLTATFSVPPTVLTVGVLANGEIWAGGTFLWAGSPSNDSVNLARLSIPQVRVLSGPTDAAICRGGSAGFSVVVGGLGVTQYQWQVQDPVRGWLPLEDGNGNMHGGGGSFVVHGAWTSSLHVSGLADQSNDFPLWPSYTFRCVVKNDCNETMSGLARIGMCLADFDCDSAITHFDYLDFVVAISTGDAEADFDRNGTIDYFDYLAFVEMFAQGC